MLALRDPARPFPTNSELGVLKWRMASRDEAAVPLTINCWPSRSGADSYVNIEYESSAAFDLRGVTIAIPLPGGRPPTVKQADGDWRFDARRGALLWTIELIDDSNRSGAMEFVVPAAEPEAFFPIEIGFSAAETLCQLEVASVTQPATGAPVKYGFKRVLTTGTYVVE